MTNSMVSAIENAGPLRVAVVPRLVPAFSYGLAVAGAGLSALLVRQVLLAMREAEAAGIGVVSPAWQRQTYPCSSLSILRS